MTGIVHACVKTQHMFASPTTYELVFDECTCSDGGGSKDGPSNGMGPQKLPKRVNK